MRAVVSTMPGIGMRFDDLEHGWPEMLKLALETGRKVSPRGMLTREIGPFMFTLTDPSRAVICNPARKLNHAFCAVEFCWVAAGQDEVDTLAFFNSRMRDFADWTGPTTWPWPTRLDPEQSPSAAKLRFFGAYGPPVEAQLGYVVDALKVDKDSRQAVLTIWRPIPPKTKDVPCTVSLQFLLRDGRLSLLTNMRSNDLWLGVPYDVPLFCRILHLVAARLGVEVGEYHHVAGSLHLYERDFGPAEQVSQMNPMGERPEELRVGRFEPDVNPRSVYYLLKLVAAGGELDLGNLDTGDGWTTLLRIANEYAIRKRTRESLLP